MVELVLRLRKAGYKIGVAPYACCDTNVPTSWVRLFWQRCRWDRTVITFECRKHADVGYPWNDHFRWSNGLLMFERSREHPASIWTTRKVTFIRKVKNKKSPHFCQNAGSEDSLQQCSKDATS